MADEYTSHPLLHHDDEKSREGWASSCSSLESGPAETHAQRPSQHRYHTVIACLVLSTIINVVQVVVSADLQPRTHTRPTIPILYSPAHSVLQPTIRKFSPAFGLGGPAAIYVQPPSSAVDDAWKALYYTTLSITRTEAELLPNKTVPLSSAPDTGYLTGLNVFHDLHCLDSIRKALWVGGLTQKAQADPSSIHQGFSRDGVLDPAVLAAYRAEMHDISHLMHCINGLRESIMCHSDVTPLSWQWSPGDQDVRVYSDVAHTCRDFEKVREWGRQHASSEGIDQSSWRDGRPPEVGRCAVEDEGCGWDS